MEFYDGDSHLLTAEFREFGSRRRSTETRPKNHDVKSGWMWFLVLSVALTASPFGALTRRR